MMKKSIFLLAAAAAAFASCTQNEVMEVAGNRAIGFSSFVDNTTKAVSETTIESLRNGFSVYGGYATVTDVFENVIVTSTDGSNWDYSPKRYWVENENYKFAAFAPATAGGTKTFNYDDGHLDIANYVADINSPVDLVYAEQTATGQASGNAAVDLSFGHIMSWIKIVFLNNFGDNVKVQVSSVDVTGVMNTANYTDKVWSAPTNEADFTPVTLLETTENGNEQIVDFIAIPQTVTTFKITFNLTVKDANDAVLADAIQKTATLSSQAWSANYIYTYTATLDGTTIGLEEIKFNPSVSGWGTGNSENLPLN